MDNMYLNLITNIFEPMIDLYIITKCMGREAKNNRLIFIMIYIIDVFLLFINIPSYQQQDYIIRHILIFILSFALYKKRFFETFIASSMINIIWEIIFIFMSIMKNKNNNIILLITLRVVINFLIIKYTYRIVQFHKFIKSYTYSPICFIVLSTLCDVLLKSYQQSEGENNLIFIGIILLGYLIFFTIGVIYFINTKNKVNTIIELTKDLDVRNCELKKIKNEHEKMIYYLHYLVASGRADEAGENMESIINSDGKNQREIIEFENYKNDIVGMVIKSCITTGGIRVIVREECELEGIMMPKMELYRVMVNIVNNAVKAMNGKGMLVIKIYEEIDEAVIIIENNGPKINDNDMKELFKAGFTTKKNEDKSHGFGLSIVKELIESYNGTISARSDDNSTEFEISLPFNK